MFYGNENKFNETKTAIKKSGNIVFFWESQENHFGWPQKRSIKFSIPSWKIDHVPPSRETLDLLLTQGTVLLPYVFQENFRFVWREKNLYNKFNRLWEKKSHFNLVSNNQQFEKGRKLHEASWILDLLLICEIVLDWGTVLPLNLTAAVVPQDAKIAGRFSFLTLSAPVEIVLASVTAVWTKISLFDSWGLFLRTLLSGSCLGDGFDLAVECFFSADGMIGCKNYKSNSHRNLQSALK